MHSFGLHDCQTLPELLKARAALHPDRIAATFVEDEATESVTYGELWSHSFAVAETLHAMMPTQSLSNPAEAPRVILAQPPGLKFISAFFGAQIAGWIPVPTSYPKPNRPNPRIDSVTRDCNPLAILSTTKTIESINRSKLSVAAAKLPMIAVDELKPRHAVDGSSALSGSISPESIALLQYTSGSTNSPKGVIVLQRNIMANVASIADGFGLQLEHLQSSDSHVVASWLPFFHDMGLMAGVLAPLWAGYQSVLMSPQAFVRRPIRWLQLISDYRAEISGGPNFAYELCADRVAPSQMESLDLSSWRLAFCGAEPIRARTLHTFAQRFSSVGFSEAAFYPCYGLAEATLLASGATGPGVPRVLEVNRTALRESRIELSAARSKRDVASLVSCGGAPPSTEIKIVDPKTSIECSERTIGEIWLRGDSITPGYWNRPDENATIFAKLESPARSISRLRWFGFSRDHSVSDAGFSSDVFFRTGDLGFLEKGELYVTGRLKDVVIVRGRNYFPQDLEATVLSLGHPVADRVVAFSIEGPRSEGLALLVEINRETTEASYHGIVRDIRRAVIEEHEIDPRIVALVRPGVISLTTSGKLQRSASRSDFLAGKLDIRHRWERSGGAESPPLPIPDLPVGAMVQDKSAIEMLVRDWLQMWLISRVGIEPADIEADRRFDDYGLDSLAAVELSGELEDWSGIELTPSTAWMHPTIATMAEYVACGLVGIEPGINPSETQLAETSTNGTHAWTAAENR